MDDAVQHFDGLKPQKGWARIPHRFVQFEAALLPRFSVYCPVIAEDTVRCDIQLVTRNGTCGYYDYGRIGRWDTGLWGVANDFNPDTDWIVSVNREVLLVGNDRIRLRDVFDHHFRWRYIRPPVLRLFPSGHELENILSRLKDIRNAFPGDLVLRYHLGPVLDVAMISDMNKTRTKFKIEGDSITVSHEEFVPPTKRRIAEFKEGLKKLSALTAKPSTPPAGQTKFPTSACTSVPGRSDLHCVVKGYSRSEHYVWVRLELVNKGDETIRWLNYSWARGTYVPDNSSPFAYQVDKRFTVYGISSNCDFRILYPNGVETLEICVGRDVGVGLLKVFIPAYFLSGFEDCFLMVETDVV